MRKYTDIAGCQSQFGISCRPATGRWASIRSGRITVQVPNPDLRERCSLRCIHV